MKKIILITILLSIVLYSCEKKVAKKVFLDKTSKQVMATSTNDSVAVDDDNNSLTSLFSVQNDDKTEEIRISAYQSSEYNKFLLVADTNYVIISKYLKRNEKFILSKKDTLVYNEYTYATIEPSTLAKKKIGNKDYVSLVIKQEYKGTAVTERNVIFYMVSLENFKVYTLVCSSSGTVRATHCDDCIDGELTFDKELDAKPEIKKSLYEVANNSKFIYHPSKKELAISYYKNYDSKWYIDNKTDNHMANGYSGINDTIYSTYYKENIFDFTGDLDGRETIENEYYKIVNFSRNNVLGFDKRKQLYFPIHIESCATGCNKIVTFVSDQEIKILFDEDYEKEYSIVNLERINFLNPNLVRQSITK